MQSMSPELWHGTTILSVRKGGTVVIGGDGQVSIGQTIVKANAKKVRRLGKGDVIGGFAGARQWNSPKTGAPIVTCGDWKR